MTVRANTLTDRASAPSGVIRAWLDAFERLGYDRTALLAAAHVDVDSLNQPDVRLPCTVYGALIETAHRMRPARNLGMQLARATPLGAYSLLDYLVLTSDTVRAAVTQLARYFRLIGAPTTFEIVDAGECTTIVVESGGSHFAAEYTIALVIFHLRTETGGVFGPERVDFVCRPDEIAELERAFGCPVTGSAESNCVVLSRRTCDLPLAHANPTLRALLEQHPDADVSDAAASTVPDQVKRVLRGRVNGGEARIEAVARELAMAPRTLQRKLGEHGLTFHDLVEDARKAAAARHLGDRRLSIAEIAYLLGYSEPAAFHRAFKRWHGVSPQAYRGRLPARD